MDKCMINYASYIGASMVNALHEQDGGSLSIVHLLSRKQMQRNKTS